MPKIPVQSKLKLLFVGRDDWQKNQYMNSVLRPHLLSPDLEMVWEDPAGAWISRMHGWERFVPFLPKRVSRWNVRMAQSLYLIFHWNYLPYLVSKKEGFSGRCRNLKRRLRSLGKGQVIMLAFSSGGRAASLIADEFPDQRVICIGYPFKKPTVPDEPERYLHLSHLKTPMLIIQGDKDEYGGPEIADRYSLSPSIELFYVDADHRYRMEQGEWDKVTGKIDSVLANPGYRRNPETALSPV